VVAFSNIGRALRPSGRIAILAWQGLAENEWLSVPRAALAMGRDLPPLGVPGPLGLADADRDREIFTAAGYENIAIEDVSEPIVAGTDPDDAYAWVSTIGPVRGLLQDLSEADKRKGLANLRQQIEAHATKDGVLFGSRAWLITASKLGEDRVVA
jgi:hypothetical protein